MKKLLELLQHQDVARLYAADRNVYDAKIVDLKAKYDALTNSTGWKHLEAVRHQRIAHTASREDATQQANHIEIDRFVSDVLNETSALLVPAAAMINCTLFSYQESQQLWSREGSTFWNRFAGEYRT